MAHEDEIELKTILSPEKVGEHAKAIADALCPKMQAQLIDSFYDKVESYLYEHHMNFQDSIFDEVFRFICGAQFSTRWNKKYQAKDLRAKIFEEHKEEIIAQIPQDLVDANASLKLRVASLEESLRNRY